MATSTQTPLASTGITHDNRSDFELEASPRWNEQLTNENESMLPPTDGGKDAWLFVAAAFMIEMMVWGKRGKLHQSCLCSCRITRVEHFANIFARVSMVLRYLPRVL